MIRKLILVASLAVLCLAGTSIAQRDRNSGERDGIGFRGRGGSERAPNERIAPEDLEFEMGVANIPDREMFEKLSYQGPEVFRDAYLADLEFVKFIIEAPGTDDEQVYWMNTENYRAHPPWMGMVGLDRRSDHMRGAITWLPRLKAPNGTPGLYIVDFEPNDAYRLEEIKTARDALTRTMPGLANKLAFHPLRGNIPIYEEEKEKYDAEEFPVHLDEDIYGDIAYLPLNAATTFGRLRVMENDARPSPRDVVIYRTLPNQMPRVAGVITEARQTPLSHVNLRAIQDKVPNAFVMNALRDKKIKPLLGKLVRYEVSPQGYKLREATKDEVDQHFAGMRPIEPQTPLRDLSQKKILPLTQIQFSDGKSFGVKAANLAAMHTFDLPAGTIPNGHALPFYFYDEFMKHNGLYKLVQNVLANPEFTNNRTKQIAELKKIRKLIKKGRMPSWMTAALTTAQKSFPAGKSIRCRSSTNNEDLPGFSGAGLYDSFTHHAQEGHLSKSIKQVFASLWNFRAFEEREFYRIDHMSAAMGVLMHVNYTNEQANGVAVTEDVLYETEGTYYVNTQIGEDLVTNPNQESSPEELLLAWKKERDSDDQIVRGSNHASSETGIMSASQHNELRTALARIYRRFANLYGKTDDDKFGMEIEFKITKEGKLAIKQARPWVF